MIDPGSAISLAASIVQLLTFTTGLLHKSKEIYKSVDGATTANSELEIIANNLSELSSQVTKKQDKSLQSKTESELAKLCDNCREVSGSLLGALQSLKRGDGNTKWQSFRQALRFVWSEGKINDLAKKMETYRRQVDTALLVSLRQGHLPPRDSKGQHE